MEVRFRKFLKDVTPEQVEIIKGTGIKSAVLFVIHAQTAKLLNLRILTLKNLLMIV